jgi:hypothetical protein
VISLGNFDKYDVSCIITGYMASKKKKKEITKVTDMRSVPRDIWMPFFSFVDTAGTIVLPFFWF